MVGLYYLSVTHVLECLGVSSRWLSSADKDANLNVYNKKKNPVILEVLAPACVKKVILMINGHIPQRSSVVANRSFKFACRHA